MNRKRSDNSDFEDFPNRRSNSQEPSDDLSSVSKRKGLISSVSSMFKWSKSGEHHEPSSSNDRGREKGKGSKQNSKKKQKRASFLEREKRKRREMERKKREEEDKCLDALAYELLMSGNEDSDSLLGFQMTVQGNRINVEAGIEFASIRSELLEDVQQLEQHYANELQKIVTKQRERLESSLGNVSRDQYEAYVRWGIRDTLRYLDILKIKVREHATMANECHSCQQQLQALLNSPVFSYAQQEKWDYQDMADQIHSLEAMTEKINRKLKRLMKVVQNPDRNDKNIIKFGDYTSIPLSESQICRLTSPQSRRNLMDLMRNYIRKLQKVSDQRNQYYHVLLRKIQNRLDESSQACESNIHEHRRRFAKLTKYCAKTIHHKEQDYEQLTLEQFLKAPLKEDVQKFFKKTVTDVVISPQQLISILNKLPPDFMERLRETLPNDPLPKPTLGDILGHEELRLAFWRFLKQRRCDENISFMLAVDNLMDEDDEALINQQINDIYHAYIADQADQQVNLSSGTQKKIAKKRSEKTTLAEFQTCYETAFKEIANLLHKEQISCFLDSQYYLDFISKFAPKNFA